MPNTLNEEWKLVSIHIDQIEEKKLHNNTVKVTIVSIPVKPK
jgi:hypothetical protein